MFSVRKIDCIKKPNHKNIYSLCLNQISVIYYMFDIDVYRWKHRVVLLYPKECDTVPHNTIKALKKNGFKVFLEPEGYQTLLNPKNPNGMLVFGLDGNIKYTGPMQSFDFINNLVYKDSNA
jgi:hypothetical protein